VRRIFVLATLVLLLTAACGGQVAEAPTPPPADTGQPEQARGGTLHVGLAQWAQHEEDGTSPDGQAHYALDPQAEYDASAFELFRCCLLRTLMSYNGTPTEEGGAELRPDLATGLPEVSADGLTWTFHLKQGIRYAPPYEDVEIVAGDVVRALERTLGPANASWAAKLASPLLGGYPFYYAPTIEGAQAFADGKADSISGLETPDDRTLIVHLTEPAGDLRERFALAATAPIPPGAADGHGDGYGPTLVSSGPYMLERYLPGRSLTLVRNPSWDPATDDLRKAYADRIELTIGGDAETVYRQVESGALDLVLDEAPPTEQARRYEADPALRDRVVAVPLDEVWYLGMVLAAPPFDDIHVRRAVNFVVDKSRLVDASGSGARIAVHIAPDSLEGNLLLDYDPYATPAHRGDLEAAKAEMRRSAYDRDGDGLCDAPACTDVPTLALIEEPLTRLIGPLRSDLAKIGLALDVEELPAGALFGKLEARKEPVALVLNIGWGKDFPNGSGWFSPIFVGSNGGDVNPSLVGWSPERLQALGYATTSVPSVDAELSECVALAGGRQTQCWAALDQRLMEQVVPWVPYLSPIEARLVSGRVESISIDQLTTLPALDRIALKKDSS
jgi:peptide/nickel transport system substrate-binding protein